jgi:hypothetical protein
MHQEQAVALLVLLKPLLQQVDARPPEMAPPTVAVVRTSEAKIKWKTPAWGDATVEYGPTTRYGATERTRRHARTHRLVLHGLTPGGTYHYRVTSRQTDGDVTVSRDFVFTMPATAMTAVPKSAATRRRQPHSASAALRRPSSS